MGGFIMSNAVQEVTPEVTQEIKLDVRAYPIAEPKGNTVAYASVTINDLVAISGIKVINGENGLFVSMPQGKGTDNKYRDIAFPVTKELRQQLNEAVIEEFGIALDAMLEQKESTLNKIRESAKAAKEKTAPAADKGLKDKTVKKGAPER
jgi:stage V sporulation protein G